MSEVPSREALWAAVEQAEKRFQTMSRLESEARRSRTAAENVLNAARKAYVDYLVAHQPAIVDELAKRRARRILATEPEQ